MSDPGSRSVAGPAGGAAAGRVLDAVERLGNRLPDPALLFFALLLAVWVSSALLSQFSYTHLDPRTGAPVAVENLLTADAMTAFLSSMVGTFVGFHPLGVVLVAMLGIGVADHSGFIRTGLRALLAVTSPRLLTPMLLFVAILSHSAADAGYVLVIPLGGVIFHAAGRHPLAGIACAFAGVSGGFSANFIPSGIDPLLQGFTQQAALGPVCFDEEIKEWLFYRGPRGYCDNGRITVLAFVHSELELRQMPGTRQAGTSKRFARSEAHQQIVDFTGAR